MLTYHSKIHYHFYDCPRINVMGRKGEGAFRLNFKGKLAVSQQVTLMGISSSSSPSSFFRLNFKGKIAVSQHTTLMGISSSSSSFFKLNFKGRMAVSQQATLMGISSSSSSSSSFFKLNFKRRMAVSQQATVMGISSSSSSFCSSPPAPTLSSSFSMPRYNCICKCTCEVFAHVAV